MGLDTVQIVPAAEAGAWSGKFSMGHHIGNGEPFQPISLSNTDPRSGCVLRLFVMAPVAGWNIACNGSASASSSG